MGDARVSKYCSQSVKKGRKAYCWLCCLPTVESFQDPASPPADRGAEKDCPSAVLGKMVHTEVVTSLKENLLNFTKLIA